MAANSLEPAETIQTHLSAVQVLLRWLQKNQGNQKFPQVMQVMAKQAEAELTAGRSVSPMEVEKLQALYFESFEGRPPDGSAGRWLRRTDFAIWWQSRKSQVATECRREGVDGAPDLICPSHPGGRGNSTVYKLDLAPLSAFNLPPDDASEGEEPTSSACRAGVIRYRVDPARPPFWARGWWIGEDGFSTRSWRGVLLMLLVAISLLLMATTGLVGGLLLWSSQTLTPKDGLLIAMLGMVAWTIWTSIRPLIALPTHRVVPAPDWLLGLSQFHGQLTLRRGGRGRLPTSAWFALVRHWGTCPQCSGEVEIARGEPEFPGRLVGRCADSPMEHVFSFDPIALEGRSLRD
jgi:hypothetical protein